MKAKVPIEPNETFHYQTYIYKEDGNIALKLDIWYPNQIKQLPPILWDWY